MLIVSDLDLAMLQPERAVPAVQQLGGGTIRLDDAGRPLRTTGHDAVIYELEVPAGRITALRCLLRPEQARDGALANLYAALQGDPGLDALRAAESPLPRDLRWIDDGIRVSGSHGRMMSAPVIAMERIPGRTLLRTVDRLCREGQTEPLALLADTWLATVTRLEEAAFSHGDLSADNLVVRPDGTIALVDLDTAYWPAREAQASLASTGTDGYTHPYGVPNERGRRDRFPALIIWASLRILARHPTLRMRWGDHPEEYGAALLWSQRDLRRASTSPLFAALDALPDASLRPLLEIVRRALRFAPHDIPPLPEIAARLDELGLPRLASARGGSGRHGRPPAAAPPSSPPPVEVFPTATHSLDLSERPLPPRPEPEMPDAGEGQMAFIAEQKVRAALAARDSVTALRLWEETQALPGVAVHAVGVYELLAHDISEAIDRAVRHNADASVIDAVAAAEGAGIAPSLEARSAARLSREREAARAALREAIARGDLAAVGELERSGRLACLGRLHPDQARVVVRALAWPALERALAADNDAAIVAAADPALWRDDGALPERAWQRLDLARRRTRWLEDVRHALRARDAATLRSLKRTAPEAAEARLTEVERRRIARITLRDEAVARLEQALRLGPDRAVVAALAEFESAGAPFSDLLDWAAVRGVVDRITLAEALRTAAAAIPPDTAQLARLLPAARAALGGETT
ncbi:MAG: phosphotransferase, partial [Thermomicrobiales bacterium]|nr:phosphotransferase [Thermomicrobiales bacterium]